MTVPFTGERQGCAPARLAVLATALTGTGYTADEVILVPEAHSLDTVFRSIELVTDTYDMPTLPDSAMR